MERLHYLHTKKPNPNLSNSESVQIKSTRFMGNSADKLRHATSDAYSAEHVILAELVCTIIVLCMHSVCI